MCFFAKPVPLSLTLLKLWWPVTKTHTLLFFCSNTDLICLRKRSSHIWPSRSERGLTDSLLSMCCFCSCLYFKEPPNRNSSPKGTFIIKFQFVWSYRWHLFIFKMLSLNKQDLKVRNRKKILNDFSISMSFLSFF